ncbi:hypothetical protein ACOMHN_002131 [Nucella lapillus]
MRPLIIALALAIDHEEEQERKRRKRRRQLRRLRGLQERARRTRVWVRPWRTEALRDSLGEFQQLLTSLELSDRAAFMNYTRMTPELFQEILQRIEPDITRQDTNYRRALQPGLKLAATLRHMATGASYINLSYSFRCGVSTISKFVLEVCSAILEAYKDEAFVAQCDQAFWVGVASQFQEKWNFSHCIGALDGKHIAIRQPPRSGSVYYNYKGFFSVPMLALVDADYTFLWLDVGGQGHMSDSQIFRNCELYEHLLGGTLHLPPATPLTQEEGDNREVPYFIVADEAFALETYIMKPYARRNMGHQELVFNYRLSRARRVVENAFGILANRFRCFLGTMVQKPENVRVIIKAAATIHNIMRQRASTPGEGDSTDGDGGQSTAGSWRDNVAWPDVHRGDGQRVGRGAHLQREYLKEYLSSPRGAVHWQWQKAGVPEPAEGQ